MAAVDAEQSVNRTNSKIDDHMSRKGLCKSVNQFFSVIGGIHFHVSGIPRLSTKLCHLLQHAGNTWIVTLSSKGKGRASTLFIVNSTDTVAKKRYICTLCPNPFMVEM